MNSCAETIAIDFTSASSTGTLDSSTSQQYARIRRHQPGEGDCFRAETVEDAVSRARAATERESGRQNVMLQLGMGWKPMVNDTSLLPYRPAHG